MEGKLKFMGNPVMNLAGFSMQPVVSILFTAYCDVIIIFSVKSFWVLAP